MILSIKCVGGVLGGLQAHEKYLRLSRGVKYLPIVFAGSVALAM